MTGRVRGSAAWVTVYTTVKKLRHFLFSCVLLLKGWVTRVSSPSRRLWSSWDLQRIHLSSPMPRLKERIRDLGDAFRWALATVATVSYGDIVPVTALGRASRRRPHGLRHSHTERLHLKPRCLPHQNSRSQNTH